MIHMSTATQNIVNKAWNFAHVLRDDGLSYMAYTEQITFLLFLKMADELTQAAVQPPADRAARVRLAEPDEARRRRTGGPLPARPGRTGKQPGMLGEIFKKARPEIQNPATLKRLIVDLIDTEKWSSMEADVKGDIYEGLLAKSAAESPKGAGQYFTPRELIKAIVDCVQPTPDDTRLRPGLRHRRLPAGRPRLRRQAPRQGPRPGPEEAPAEELRAGLGAGAQHGPPVHYEPLPARHRRRSLPGQVRRGQPGRRSGRAVQPGLDQSALRQESRASPSSTRRATWKRKSTATSGRISGRRRRTSS